MAEGKVWEPPQELRSLPSNSLVVKVKLLIPVKHWELDEASWVLKARFVALGNLIYDIYLRVLRRNELQKGNFWPPVVSKTGSRIIDARAVAHKRRSESIDLIAAYLQTWLRTKNPVALLHDRRRIQYMPEEMRASFESLDMPTTILNS